MHLTLGDLIVKFCPVGPHQIPDMPRANRKYYWVKSFDWFRHIASLRKEAQYINCVLIIYLKGNPGGSLILQFCNPYNYPA